MKHARNEAVKSMFAAIEKPDYAKIDRRAPSVARLFFDRVAATPHAKLSGIRATTGRRA